ncbi:MAG TPA: hypothetical protein VFJ61_05575 [Solirubrobacterales bacterium]|nr:hypothetical protein [Solirubrobacterales bacterium]
MEELNPPPLDPEQIDPDPGAEPIAALTFLLELPHCLRIEEAIFLVSDRGGSWPGWNPHAIGHMAGFERALPEDDLRPRFKVHIKQTLIDGWVPLLAAEKAFPGWAEVKRPRRPPGPTSRGKDELRSVIEITTYELADQTPLGSDAGDQERFRHDTIEWLSRRLDEVLSFLNQYLVILAGMRDEWHMSALSRSDLPRDAPWKLTLFPMLADWTGPSGTLDVHATIRDDLPAERSAEEITYAIEAVHQARRGQAPFFQFVELYQAAEHHLGSGRHDQSVIAACTATEVLVNTLFRVLWVCLEREPTKLPGVLSAPFKNQLIDLVPKYVVGAPVDLNDTGTAPGRWYAECYKLRNQIVHEGQKAGAGEAYDAKVATGDFARWIGQELQVDPRTEWIKNFLDFRRVS